MRRAYIMSGRSQIDSFIALPPTPGAGTKFCVKSPEGRDETTRNYATNAQESGRNYVTNMLAAI